MTDSVGAMDALKAFKGPTAEAMLIIHDDGGWQINPDCVAYPDNESGYTGVLEYVHPDGGWATMEWCVGDRSNVVYSKATGEDLLLLSDICYVALQQGLVRAGVR